ncbi:DUF1254 domain-containing protein [Variovorax robiniae]|uniref:DUF1254 domain-containing protein n=1 Tax=Variovorax robiniae TaxID=1836199 RepID=A0ABU8XC45_9BURK
MKTLPQRSAVKAVMLAASLLVAAVMPGRTIAQTVSAAEAQAIAKEATIYGFPLVDNYRVLHTYFVDRSSPEFKAPWNRIANEARVYTPDDKAIQTPNSDTPYSQLGADLRAGPLVISMPAVAEGRYFSAQFVDLYTHNFAYAGNRATGRKAGRFLLAGPGWNGKVPEGIDGVIRSETEFAFVFYRTQLFDAADIENVKAVQAGYKVQTLAEYLGQAVTATVPAVDFAKPLAAGQERTSIEFFNVLNFVLRFCPVHPSETELRARLARLGIDGRAGFDAKTLPAETRAAMERGMAEAWVEFAGLEKRVNAGQVKSGEVFGSREHLKNNYLYRMFGAERGIYGLSQEEAVYLSYFTDAGGARLDAAKNRYALRFAPGQLPPVDSFWSLTMYEFPSRMLVANPLKRYLVNSPMLPSLQRDADGGITLYVQHDPPGKDKEANWLPAPEGAFFTALRLYAPKAEAIDGRWKRPAMKVATSAEAAP